MKLDNYFQFLLSISLFRGFTKEELKNVLNNGFSIKDIGRNEIIYIQNEKANFMDIILEGEVTIQNIDENGNILSIVNLGPGDMLGGNLIFSENNEYPMTIIGKTNVKLFPMSKELVLELCQSNEDFLINFLELLSSKALVLTTKIHSLAMKTIREKIMDFLIFESRRQKSHKIKLPLSKKELAEKFGVERPSLQRELRKMKEEGLIDYDAWSITLRQ